MTDTNTNDKSIEEMLKDPQFANLPDDAEIPDELLDKMEGADLAAVFVEQMIADKGLEPTDELRNELLEGLVTATNREILSNLPDYMVAKLENEANEGKDIDEELTKMVEEAGIDVDTVVENAMLGFRDKYLNGDKAENAENTETEETEEKEEE